MGKNPASKAFVLAIALSVVLPFIPILKWGLYPFDLLNTHLHEMFHAIAATVTGGQVMHIEVYKSTEGLTLFRGGFAPVIQMSGYLGASLFGALMVMACKHEKASVIWLRILGGPVLISNVLWVRGDVIGWSFGVLWAVIIFFASVRLKGENLLLAAQFLAVQQCLNSVKSLRDLVILSTSDRTTDAQLLAQSTHIPALVWATLWTLVGVFGIGAAILKLNKTPKKSTTVEP